MRIRDYGITIGNGTPGPLNKITDVKGVLVGHKTIINERHQTGVSVIVPCPENPFTHKLPAASFVLNGYGKSQGTIQIDELGTLETPIALTNTLNIGKVHDAMVEYMINRCEQDGVNLVSVNPVVCECNDSALNKITERIVSREDVFEAFDNACEDFEEGAVGGGRGMICHSLKGGIGSSSRIINFDGTDYTIGILVQTNHGLIHNLTVNGDPVGKKITHGEMVKCPDKGSCIIILATDLPVTDRQLKRMLRRCGNGLARVGSYTGHGSGEVFIGFSTANRECAGDPCVRDIKMLRDDCLDGCFALVTEAVEEAVLNSLITAEEVTGYSGLTVDALKDYLPRPE